MKGKGGLNCSPAGRADVGNLSRRVIPTETPTGEEEKAGRRKESGEEPVPKRGQP